MKEDNTKSTKTILLIDGSEIDMFVNQRLIKLVYPDSKILSFERVDWALDFLKLISISDEKKFPDVIILDPYIPNADDGFEFLKEYESLTKNLDSKPHVIVICCSLNPNDEIKSLQCSSVKEYVIKPLSPDKIYNILAN